MKKYLKRLKIAVCTVIALLVAFQTPAMAFDLGNMDKKTFLIIFVVALLLPIPVMLILGRKSSRDDDYSDDDYDYEEEDDDDDDYAPRKKLPRPQIQPDYQDYGSANAGESATMCFRSVSLTGTKGFYSGQQLTLSSFPTTLGRDSSRCQIMFPANSQTISRVHCIINGANGTYSVQDLSSNGTWVNGQKLPKGGTMPLSNGSEISLAKGVEVFRFSC